MYSHNEIVLEVRKMIDDRIERGEITTLHWAVTAIAKKHRPRWFAGRLKKGDRTAEYFVVHERDNLISVVRSVVNAHEDPTSKPDEQYILAGFERLQTAYSVKRKAGKRIEQMIVPIDQLSLAELLAKIIEYEAMRAGLDLHIQELRRYVGIRFPSGDGTLAAA